MVSFLSTHILFAIFLGRVYALTPDETGYLYTFNHLYETDFATPQYQSGWISAPKIFLRVVYLPAKILNLIGVSDYLSIRILSIFLTAFCIYLLKNILDSSITSVKSLRRPILIVFFIPSVFLWNSVGLRESFIMAEITIFLAGVNLLFKNDSKHGLVFLFIGSYGLLSTKSYLWACLMVTIVLSSIIFVIKKINYRKIFKLIIIGFLTPLIAFASTSSVYALNFILHSSISETGQRSGDSITKINLDGTGTGTGTGKLPPKELLTFHGDYTLIGLHFFLIDNPDSLFTKAFIILNLDKKIQRIWDEKVALGLVNEDKIVGTDTSSLNGHILTPGKISSPSSLIWPAFVFLCGPFPFIGDPGIAVSISSLESPLWWAFYALVIFQFIKFRKVKILSDPQIILTLIFLVGEITFSTLVEVNLGTSFRHRSILLVPLVFLYVRLAQKAKEQKDLESGVI